jgi:predicted O-linked N-acetylglucosamine transferase (SPINDLY family)
LLTLTRRDFRLREDAAVFLCCQAVYKFLPQNDCVLTEIARRVPHAQFVFTVTNPVVSADLEGRLGCAFAAAGLRAADHCVFLPQLARHRYWNLHRVADVFLDTIGWSSAVSTFEALACRVPVVTLPGELMRSRQAAAILSQLEVPETIAQHRADYVEIAARLVMDSTFRMEIVEKIVRNSPLLYNDRRPVSALDDFFRSACAATRASANFR